MGPARMMTNGNLIGLAGSRRPTTIKPSGGAHTKQTKHSTAWRRRARSIIAQVRAIFSLRDSIAKINKPLARRLFVWPSRHTNCRPFSALDTIRPARRRDHIGLSGTSPAARLGPRAGANPRRPRWAAAARLGPRAWPRVDTAVTLAASARPPPALSSPGQRLASTQACPCWPPFWAGATFVRNFRPVAARRRHRRTQTIRQASS